MGGTDWRVMPPPTAAVSPVGSGDSFLAGLRRGYEPVEALRLTVAAGTASYQVLTKPQEDHTRQDQ